MHRINVRVHNFEGTELKPCRATEAIGRTLENFEKLTVVFYENDAVIATYTCCNYSFDEEADLARWILTLVSASGDKIDIILFYYHETQKYGSGWKGEWEIFCKKDAFPRTITRITFSSEILRMNEGYDFSCACSVTFVTSLERHLSVYKRRRKKRLALDRKARHLAERNSSS